LIHHHKLLDTMDALSPDKKSFLGKGWAFPVTFLRDKSEQDAQGMGCPPEAGGADTYLPMTTSGDRVQTASEVELIEQSLTILFGTRPGERVMRPDYGCALDDALFEPANTSLLTYVKDLISKAVLYYEPRVQLRSVDIVMDHLLEGQILIELDLIVRSTNSRYNFVYDYYKREATIR